MFGRSLASTIFGLAKNRSRYRGEYLRFHALFREAANWSEDRLRTYQDERLRAVVTAAATYVPFYRNRFARLGVDPSSIRRVEDLTQLPILDKSDVIAAGRELVSRQEPCPKIRTFPTSGSTGTPLVVHHPDSILQLEWAFLWARFRPADTLNQPFSSFTGLELLPASRKKPPYWVENWASRQRMYSIFHMNENTLGDYLRSLDQRYSDYYLGYPSAIYTICEYMHRHGLRLRRPPRYVFSASEELQPHYATTIRDVLGARVMNRYGNNEMIGSITEYDCGHMHYDMDYSIIEFLPVGREGEGELIAEIIATAMYNETWPLIRYRTGDLVVYDPQEQCSAGRPGAIIRRIHGRTGRYFTLPNGSRITNISVISKKCTNVKLMQVVQRRPGAITVRVVRGVAYGPSDEQRVREQFRRKLGDELAINIEHVDEIERTPSGKFISIVNETSEASTSIRAS
jgi:phenylacetate-CoA ligase